MCRLVRRAQAVKPSRDAVVIFRPAAIGTVEVVALASSGQPLGFRNSSAVSISKAIRQTIATAATAAGRNVPPCVWRACRPTWSHTGTWSAANRFTVALPDRISGGTTVADSRPSLYPEVTSSVVACSNSSPER